MPMILGEIENKEPNVNQQIVVNIVPTQENMGRINAAYNELDHTIQGLVNTAALSLQGVPPPNNYLVATVGSVGRGNLDVTFCGRTTRIVFEIDSESPGEPSSDDKLLFIRAEVQRLVIDYSFPSRQRPESTGCHLYFDRRGNAYRAKEGTSNTGLGHDVFFDFILESVVSEMVRPL